MSAPLRFLVVDAYPQVGRQRLTDVGGTEAGTLYRRLLERIAPDVAIDIVYPADEARDLPLESDLERYDGAAWTGSNLSILDEDDPQVGRQVALARSLLDAGVPNFGSCFAIQVATVATGGRCAANPKGREFGISRAIRLSAAGREHPLYRGKPEVFDAFTSHADEVAEPAPNTLHLAANDWSRFQGASIDDGRRSFWAVQYHPEYDLHEVASLCRLRQDELLTQGTFASSEEAERYTEDLEALHADPTRRDIASARGIGETLLDPDVRTLEVRNWVEWVRARSS